MATKSAPPKKLFGLSVVEVELHHPSTAKVDHFFAATDNSYGLSPKPRTLPGNYWPFAPATLDLA